MNFRCGAGGRGADVGLSLEKMGVGGAIDGWVEEQR